MAAGLALESRGSVLLFLFYVGSIVLFSWKTFEVCSPSSGWSLLTEPVVEHWRGQDENAHSWN